MCATSCSQGAQRDALVVFLDVCPANSDGARLPEAELGGVGHAEGEDDVDRTADTRTRSRERERPPFRRPPQTARHMLLERVSFEKRIGG